MISRSRAPLVALMLGIAFATASNSTAAEDPAHALAQRFADGAAKDEARKKEKEDAARRAAEEAEMLARARAEADARKAAADKARAEAEAHERKRLADQERAKKQRLAEEQRQVREKFIAEQIRAEEERQRAEAARAKDEKRAAEAEKRRRAEEQRIADEKRIAELKRAQKERERAEQERLAEERRLADEKRAAEKERLAKARRQELATAHEAAHERRAERMRELERERAARERTATTPGAVAPGSALPAIAARNASAPSVRAPAMSLGAAPATKTATKTPPERVTILLAMQPGKTGIRRFGRKTADPVLCAGPTCWIASGTGRAARKVSRGLALGPANTMGTRAAACNRHLTCVFRDVDLDAPSASIQPIDLRILRHDRREPLRLEADRTCRLAGKTLLCDKLFVSRSWRAWVIDEDLARKAGPDALASALANGLSKSQSAALHATH